MAETRRKCKTLLARAVHGFAASGMAGGITHGESAGSGSVIGNNACATKQETPSLVGTSQQPVPAPMSLPIVERLVTREISQVPRWA